MFFTIYSLYATFKQHFANKKTLKNRKNYGKSCF